MTSNGRILFVDDEPQCLEALRSQAGRLGDDWEAEFLDSPAVSEFITRESGNKENANEPNV